MAESIWHVKGSWTQPTTYVDRIVVQLGYHRTTFYECLRCTWVTKQTVIGQLFHFPVTWVMWNGESLYSSNGYCMLTSWLIQSYDQIVVENHCLEGVSQYHGTINHPQRNYKCYRRYQYYSFCFRNEFLGGLLIQHNMPKNKYIYLHCLFNEREPNSYTPWWFKTLPDG